MAYEIEKWQAVRLAALIVSFMINETDTSILGSFYKP